MYKVDRRLVATEKDNTRIELSMQNLEYFKIPNGFKTIQYDLDKFSARENRWHLRGWHMKFHANKCVVLTVSSRKKSMHAGPKLHGQSLASQISQVSLSYHHLKWDQQIKNICDKANWTTAWDGT